MATVATFKTLRAMVEQEGLQEALEYKNAITGKVMFCAAIEPEDVDRLRTSPSVLQDSIRWVYEGQRWSFPAHHPNLPQPSVAETPEISFGFCKRIVRVLPGPLNALEFRPSRGWLMIQVCTPRGMYERNSVYCMSTGMCSADLLEIPGLVDHLRDRFKPWAGMLMDEVPGNVLWIGWTKDRCLGTRYHESEKHVRGVFGPSLVRLKQYGGYDTTDSERFEADDADCQSW